MNHPAWRRAPFSLRDSGIHVGLSDALSRCGETPTVWWHATRHPTLIVGTAQQLSQFTLESCQSLGITVVRRQSGGSAVFATDKVLGLDVFVPREHVLAVNDILQSYEWLGRIWLGACASLGISGRLVQVAEARIAEKTKGLLSEVLEAACFGTLSPFEVVVKDRKLVGLAQVRRRAGVLLQSGIHLHFDAETLAGLLAPQKRVDIATSLLSVAIGADEAARRRVESTEIIDSFEQSLVRMFDWPLIDGAWTEQEIEHATHYGRPE